MVKRSTIAREFRDAGAVHTLLNLWAFISEHVLLTKSGDLAVVLKMEPRDYECLDAEELAEVPRRYEAALRSFDPLFRVYQYTFKRSGASVPQRGLEAPGNFSQLPGIKAFVVARLHFEHDGQIAALGEQYMVGNECPKIEECVDCARFAEFPRNCRTLNHGAPPSRRTPLSWPRRIDP